MTLEMFCVLCRQDVWWLACVMFVHVWTKSEVVISQCMCMCVCVHVCTCVHTVELDQDKWRDQCLHVCICICVCVWTAGRHLLLMVLRTQRSRSWHVLVKASLHWVEVTGTWCRRLLRTLWHGCCILIHISASVCSKCWHIGGLSLVISCHRIDLFYLTHHMPSRYSLYSRVVIWDMLASSGLSVLCW